MDYVMSRILIDLPEAQVKELAALVETEHRPRAALVREAIQEYISLRKKARGGDVFGLWEDRRADGLEYQQELRAEW